MNRGPRSKDRLRLMSASLLSGRAARPAASTTAAGVAAPFGSWTSPITSSLLTASSLRLGAARAESGYVVWNEGRPQEGGRQVLVRGNLATGAIDDVTPPGDEWNARTTVHEYGGGEFTPAPGGKELYFSNFADQRLYAQAVGGAPRPLTAEDAPLRFADYVLDITRQRLIAVVEDHTDDRPSAVRNFIGAVSLAGASADGLRVEPLVGKVGEVELAAARRRRELAPSVLVHLRS